MSEPAINFGEDGDTGPYLQEFSVITPNRSSLKWLPIKGDGLTIYFERDPTKGKVEDYGPGVRGENSE